MFYAGSRRSAVVSLLVMQSLGRKFDPRSFSLSDETLNRGPMTIVKDKLLSWTCSDETGDYAVPPRDLVSRLSDIYWSIIIIIYA